ncbi:GGDEF domain-containing protein [Massilia sp. 9096]|uniref:GGDEF domain-containing protein n=1 Tax=Massilia sp. 9096 TaxID=1500894 RepID=UPI000568F419|nr:GGDEF domain-containing protein [Massilia sp. 9096]
MDSIGTFGASRYAIRDLQLLRDADTPAVTRLLAGCAVLRVTRGNRVEGLHARLLIVLAGALGIEAEGFVGDSGLTRILPGESVGEQAVLDEAANLESIVALEDSEVLVIEPELVWQLIEQHNGVARNLLRLLSFRIRAANALLRRRQKLGEFYRQLSMNDGLTGLYNRAWLNDMLPKLVGRARQDGMPLSLVMIDLDHFKRFNDTHGHMIGDHALVTAAGVIRAGLRPADFAVRYGGEEMMAILPHTALSAAVLVAERLCARLRESVVFDDMRLPLPHLTGSFGVASLDSHQDERSLVADADAALYRAKQAGRDRICT